MFEEYLEDARHYANEGRNAADERVAKRAYRSAVFCIAAAVEAFVNYVADTLEQGGKFEAHEIAFLTDKKFGLTGGAFQKLNQAEFHRLEDKLVFLLTKFRANFDRATNPNWARFQEFKKLRDAITHPRSAEDEIPLTRYKKMVESGLPSSIGIMDSLCKSVFRRRLRKRILDLAE